MKVIIDIDERAYKGCLKLKSNDDMGVLGFHLINATANGTLLSDKATNGDVIKALFPNVRYKEGGYSITLYFDKKIGTIVPSEWWNARYKENRE